MKDAEFERNFLEIRGKMLAVESEIKKAVLGIDRVIHLVTIAFFSRGHVLLEGLPGVGKTTLLLALARVVEGAFHRIVGKPDLTPNDILYIIKFNPSGNIYIDVKDWVKQEGKLAILFVNEINRLQEKTQAVFLDLMQERKVHAEAIDKAFDLPNLWVCGDRNPLEKEQTFELPHAERDRFLMEIYVPYPDEDSEKIIIRDPEFRDVGKLLNRVKPVVKIEEIRFCADWIEHNIYVSSALIKYLHDLVLATRKPSLYGISIPGVEDAGDILLAGVSPRVNMIRAAAQTAAIFRGSEVVEPCDIHNILTETFAHRIFFKNTAVTRRSNISKIFLEEIKKKVGM